MNGKLDSKLLDEALTTLAELLGGQPPRQFVVCGGSSLLALGLVNRRTTKDVDVLASIEEGSLVMTAPLPPPVVKAVEQVRIDFGLLENWFNADPSDETFFRFGFPGGMLERAIPRIYGEALTIFFIARYDQIFFKLYAAVDSDGGRHFDDLLELAPIAEELLSATRWTLQHDDSAGFRLNLAHILKELGHDGLLDRI